MQFDFALFLRALGLAIVLEGLCWALAPGAMRRAMRRLMREPDGAVRAAGLFAMAAGLCLVWLAV